MKAHGDDHRAMRLRQLTDEQRKGLHPMQVEMLGEPPHFGRFGILNGEKGNLQLTSDDRDTCSYCGSIGIDDAIAAFETPGVEWSGSDWKYGWPHKFYLEIPCAAYERIVGACWTGGQRMDTREVCTRRSYKFYSTHMRDATPEQAARWNDVVGPLCGIEFEVDGQGLRWRSRYGRNYQGHGIVG